MYSNIMEIKFPNKSDNERFARTVAAAFVLELDPTVDQIAEIKTAVSEAERENRFSQVNPKWNAAEWVLR